MGERSASSKAVDAVLKVAADPILKAVGFRKRTRSYYAESDRVFRIVWFQASQGNSPEMADFTANLHVVFPEFHVAYTGKPFPKNPGSAVPVIQQRIGLVLDEHRDVWWTVTGGKDVERVASSVAAALPRAITFLDGFTSRAALIQRLRSSAPGIRAMHVRGLAALLVNAGQTDEARSLLEEELRSAEIASYSESIRAFGTRLGLTI